MGTLGDTDRWEKSEDFVRLMEFVEQYEGNAGLYLSGNDIVEDWDRKWQAAGAVPLKQYIDHNVTSVSAAQFGVSPRILATGTGQIPGMGCDEFVAFGGCPGVAEFDVVQPTGNAVLEMSYEGTGVGGVLSQETADSYGDTARVVLETFSFHRIVNAGNAAPLARVEHLHDILDWFGVTMDSIGTGPCVVWRPEPPAASPPARFDHGMAYQASTYPRVILFGGISGLGGPSLDDTWLWDGSNWQEFGASPHPSARGGNQMAYDEANGRTVLFGGVTEPGGTIHGDTWQWTGASWHMESPSTSPSPRFACGMTYDAARGRVILFGGNTGAGTASDTWEWDGTDWSLITPDHSPPARYFLGGNGLAYDPDREVVVLFGGNSGSAFLGDTWEWDGTDWTQRTPSPSPSARDGHALAFVPGMGVVLMGGNANSKFQDDTWRWDGTSWLQLHTPLQMDARHRHAMAWDAGHSNLVLFGGWDFTPPFDDTWIFEVCSETIPTRVDDTPHFANALRPNYPNPFNPATTIAFSLRARGHVRIAVYDVAGRLVRVLLDDVRDAGDYADVRWDGINRDGVPVATGVYFCRLQTNGFAATRKLVLVK